MKVIDAGFFYSENKRKIPGWSAMRLFTLGSKANGRWCDASQHVRIWVTFSYAGTSLWVLTCAYFRTGLRVLTYSYAGTDVCVS
eukprot:821075-Rhodomonas_salina.2